MGYVVIGALLLLDAGLLFLLLNQPVTLLSFFWGATLFISCPVIAFMAYCTAALSRARYVLDDETLRIEWGPVHHTIPLAAIHRVTPPGAAESANRFRGVRWPGHLFGRGQLARESEDGAPVFFFATRPPRYQILVQTASATYGLTPDDSQGFQASLQDRLAHVTGAGDDAGPDLGWLSWPIWRDGTALALFMAALLLNGLLFAYLSAVYPNAPANISLRPGAARVLGNSAGAGRLFLLPSFGLITWLGNGVLGFIFYRRRERVLAYLLWAVAVAVQSGAWIAIVLLLR